MKIEMKAQLISEYVQEWLRINNRNEAKPEEIMQYLKDKGLYNENRKSASHLRSDLRKLIEINKLELISGLEYEQKDKNKYWYFRKV